MVNDVPINFLGNRIEFHAFGFVNRIEQRRKRMTQVEAAPATMANIEYAL